MFYLFAKQINLQPKPDTWNIFWDPQKLNKLTTLTITSIVCAALNSRRRLHWVIGVGHDRKVITCFFSFGNLRINRFLIQILGCSVTTEERDTLRQAFIYAVRSGITPQLHPNLVDIRFICVEGQQLDEKDIRLLVTITIEHRVTTVFLCVSFIAIIATGSPVQSANTSFPLTHIQ